MSTYEDRKKLQGELEMLTGETVTAAKMGELVSLLEQIADDDEAAHGAEDEIHALALAAARSRNPESAEIAAQALATAAIEFSRWCA